MRREGKQEGGMLPTQSYWANHTHIPPPHTHTPHQPSHHNFIPIM